MRIHMDPRYFGMLDPDQDPDQHQIDKLDIDPDLDCIHKVKIQKLQRLKMEPWGACKLMLADSHYCDEKQNPDPAEK